MKQNDHVDPLMIIMWWCLKLGCDVGSAGFVFATMGPVAGCIFVITKVIENKTIDYAFNKGYPIGVLISDAPGPVNFVPSNFEDRWNKTIEQHYQYEIEEKETLLQLEDMPGPNVIYQNQINYLVETIPSNYAQISTPVN